MHTTIYSISESPKNAERDLGRHRRRQRAAHARRRQELDQRRRQRARACRRARGCQWVEAGRFDAGTAYATFDRHTFGDMAPYVYETTRLRQDLERARRAGRKGVRGYAHVIKEDPVKPDLLFLGTEFGLWISIDGGATWAQFKGGDFPAVAVRDIAFQKRDGDLVLATHGRGIWIIDDLTPLRALDDEDARRRPRSCRRGRSSSASARSAAGSKAMRGSPARIRRPAPMITYYQGTATSSASSRSTSSTTRASSSTRSRRASAAASTASTWSMRVKPPRVPPAAQIAFNSTQGPRVRRARTRVRMTKGKEVDETKIDVGLDRRAPYTAADRKAQYDAAMNARAAVRRDEHARRSDRRRAQADEERRASCRRQRSARRQLAALSASPTNARRSSRRRKAARSPARSACASTWTRCTARSTLGRQAGGLSARAHRRAAASELGDVEKAFDALVGEGRPRRSMTSSSSTSSSRCPRSATRGRRPARRRGDRVPRRRRRDCGGSTDKAATERD